MPTNNFKLFDQNKANLLSDTEYANATQRLNGVQTGVASSQLNNKFAYQVSLVAYAIAQIMNQNGLDASDTLAVSAFVGNLGGSLLQKVADKATEEEVIKGIVDNKYITPKNAKALATTAIVNVFADVGTTVTMSKGDKTLTATVQSNGCAILHPAELGDWTVVFSYKGSQKTKVYTLEVIGIVYVYPFVVGATLEATSWDNIAAVSKFGQAPNYWKVGDKKNITVNGVTYAAQIIGFDHDTLTTADGSRTKAGITFQLVDCLNTTYSMNGSNTNVNGWRGSTMRTSTMATLLNQLSSDLKSVLEFVNKVTSVGSNSSGLETTSDKLFLLSEIEVFGATQYSYAGEGKQYEYYTAGNSTIKKVNGSANNWWERSPHSGSTDIFCNVHNNGNASYNGAIYSGGVSFGFCV